MTQEEKELLLKDLCARWRYGVKAQIKRKSLKLNEPVILDLPINGVINFASVDSVITVTENGDIVYDQISNCKPYLRPMSSMTEEEFLEYHNIKYNKVTCRNNYERIDVGKFHNVGIVPIEDYLDWLNAHHFDYRGLIPMGLALEAKEGMY